MKKIYSITAAAGLALALTGCGSTGPATPASVDPLTLDVKKLCNVKANGIENVVATAKRYNAIAKKNGVEFRRLNVNNSDLIASVEDAIKTGAKKVNPVHFKSKPNKIKKSKTKLETNYAAERSCKFAISALIQEAEGKTTWKLAVPGDGYKY